MILSHRFLLDRGFISSGAEISFLSPSSFSPFPYPEFIRDICHLCPYACYTLLAFIESLNLYYIFCSIKGTPIFRTYFRWVFSFIMCVLWSEQFSHSTLSINKSKQIVNKTRHSLLFIPRFSDSYNNSILIWMLLICIKWTCDWYKKNLWKTHPFFLQVKKI